MIGILFHTLVYIFAIYLTYLVLFKTDKIEYDGFRKENGKRRKLELINIVKVCLIFFTFMPALNILYVLLGYFFLGIGANEKELYVDSWLFKN